MRGAHDVPHAVRARALAFRHEAELLARAADAEREYVEVIMPAKLRHALEYAERATLWTDLRLIGRTLKAIWLDG